ncbi:MAG: hypothetical protein IPL10_17425 [Bacteroidetes bacterium]|nr:hypothetical protein [Bacteroidota bacterium]
MVASCKKEAEESIEITQNLDMDSRILNFDNTRVEGDAAQGNFYSSADSTKGFTIGYSYIVPDSLKNKKVKIYVSAMLREKELPQQGDLVVVINSSKGNIAWQSIGRFGLKMAPNKWIKVNDSLEFSADKFNDPKIEIGVIGTKSQGGDAFDVDDLRVKFKFIK